MTQASERTFFPIREVCRLTSVPAYTLRYWESKFQLLRPTRLEGGQRKYTREDVDTVLKIKDLLVRQRMTLQGAKRALSARARARTLDKEGAQDLGGRALAREVRQELDGILEDLARAARPQT